MKNNIQVVGSMGLVGHLGIAGEKKRIIRLQERTAQ